MRLAPVTLLLLLGCDGFDFDGVRISSAHFDYWHREDDSVPAGLLDELERHYLWTHSYLGLPTTGRVAYDKFRDLEDIDAHALCSARRGGCARGGAVFSVENLHEHELVHAYTLPHWRMPSFIVEGVAVALVCSAELHPGPPLTWKNLVGDHGDHYNAGTYYYPAGQLVAGVLHLEDGPAKLARLVASYPFGRPDLVPAVFREATGVEIDSFWDRLVSSNAPPCVGAWQCSAPVGDGDVLSTATPFPTWRGLDTTTAPGLHVTVRGPGGATERSLRGFEALGCSRGSPGPLVFFADDRSGVAEHWVEQGIEDVAVAGSARGTPLTLTKERAGGPIATMTCGEGMAITVGSDHATWIHLRGQGSHPLSPIEEPTAYVRLRAPDVDTPFRIVSGLGGSALVSICPSCSAGTADCQTVDAAEGAMVTVRGDFVLHPTWLSPNLWYSAGWMPIGFLPGS